MKNYVIADSAAHEAGCKMTVLLEGSGADELAGRVANQIKKENRRRKLRGDLPIRYSVCSLENATSISS